MTGDTPIRLSAIEMVILKMLIGQGRWLYGLEMVKFSEGRVKRGTVYVTLSRMEDKGYIESRKENPETGARGLPKRRYRPTALGKRVLDAWEINAFSMVAGGANL